MTAVTSLGFGKAMEKKLFSVRIHTAEESTELGSKQAASGLKAKYPATCVVVLCYWEAAIREVAELLVLFVWLRSLSNYNLFSKIKAFGDFKNTLWF